MTQDERAIRDVVDTWLAASRACDLDTVLGLMTDDAIFMVPGLEPFGKEAFAAQSRARAQSDVQLDVTGEIQEIQIFDRISYVRNYLELTLTSPDSQPVTKAGYILTIFRKEDDGQWRLARDANILV